MQKPSINKGVTSDSAGKTAVWHIVNIGLILVVKLLQPTYKILILCDLHCFVQLYMRACKQDTAALMTGVSVKG